MIANNVTIAAGGHKYDRTDMPMRFQGAESAPVIIEPDVWIGASASVLGGITIRRGTIIGANAVVTKTFPEYSILAGVPARVIKYRRASLNANAV